MKKIYFFLSIFILLFFGCATTGGKEKLFVKQRPLINKNPYQEAVSLLYFSMGYLASLSGNYDAAEENFLISSKYAYEPGTIYLELADIRNKKGTPELAKETINEGVEKDPWHPDLLVMAARNMMEKEDYKNALLALNRAIELDPTLDEAYFYSGVVNYKLGNTEQAEADFKKSVALMDKSSAAAAFYNIGYIYTAKKDYEKALEFMRKSIEADNSYLKGYDAISRIKEEQGDIEGAVNAFKEYLKIYPDDTDIMGLIAEIYFRAGMLEEAERQYDAIIKSNPEAYDAIFEKGKIRMKKENFTEALKMFEEIEKKRPENINAKYFAGICLEELKRYDEAVLKYRKVIEIDKRLVNAWFRIGVCMDKLGKLNELMPEFQALLDSEPGNEDYYHLVASAWGDLKNFDKAIEVYNLARERFPDSEKTAFNAAFLYDKAKQKEKAIKAFRDVIRINPKNAEAYNYIGYVYAEEGRNLDEALNLVKKALELDPGNAFYLDSLGWVYFKMGRYQEALEKLKDSVTALEKEKRKDGVIYEHLGDAYMKVGDKEKGMEWYLKALDNNPEDREALLKKIKEAGGN